MNYAPFARFFRLLTILAVVVATFVSGIRVSTAQPEDKVLISTSSIQLAGGEMTWEAENATTRSESDLALPFPTGLIVALDDPLLLFFEGGARLERLQADKAVAVPELVDALPVAMMEEDAVPYLGIALLDSQQATDDPDSKPFTVEAGDYDLSLWRLDQAIPLTNEHNARLAAVKIPMLVYVRQGAVNAPSDAGAEPERLEAGDWTVIEPGVTLSPADGEVPPVLLLVTLDQPLVDAAAQPNASQSGRGANQQPTGRQPTSVVATESPTGEPAAPPTETPVPPVAPTTIPTDAPVEEPDSGEFDPGAGGVELTCESSFADSDGDGITDACEAENGTDPNVPEGGQGNSSGSKSSSTGCSSDLVVLCVEESSMFSESALEPAEEPASEISVVDQVSLTCNLTTTDGDGDGLVDACETEYGTNLAEPDSDGDTLADGDEVYTHKSDPIVKDTDGDTLPDGDEVNTHKTSPVTTDTDGDDLADNTEIQNYRTDPTKFDSDADGLGDGYELGAGLDPFDSDFDDDGLSDGDEITFGSYPKVADSDGEGLLDGDEFTYGTNPLVRDTDGDCGNDDEEVNGEGTNPLSQDSDGDGTLDRVDLEPANSAEAGLVYEGFDWCD